MIRDIADLRDIVTDARDGDEDAQAFVQGFIDAGLASDIDGVEQYGDDIDPTCIEDVHFEDYARELAEDIGAVASDATWPNYCIDWERAARDLRMDYSSFDVGTQTWWVRQ